MDMKNWPRVNFDPELYQICKKNLVTTITKKLSDDLESLHFLTFSTKRTNAKLGREMVMENQEMVMEKSQKNILSRNPVI